MAKIESALQGIFVGKYTQMPDKMTDKHNVLGLTMPQRAVFWVIMTIYPKNQLSFAEIAMMAGMSVSLAKSTVKTLVLRGLLHAVTKPGGVTAYDFTPMLARLNNPLVSEPAAPAVEFDEQPPPEHPDDVKYKPSQDDYDKSEAVMRAIAGVDKEQKAAAGKKLSIGELPAQDLQKRIEDVRVTAARLYYPSLGEEACDELLHDIVHACYEDAEDVTHQDVWMAIESVYKDRLKERAAVARYDGMAEYMRISGVYGRYSENHDEREGHPLTLQEFLIRYYGKKKEFREFDNADL